MKDDFAKNLSDVDYMRIAVSLAQKSYDKGGCPIGAVIVNNSTKAIFGKGHNTLVREDRPYNHVDCRLIDAGRIEFGNTTIYTSLNPCAMRVASLQVRL